MVAEDKVETTLSEWPSEMQPKELMFFSIDVVGSTAMKQKPVMAGNALVPDNSEWFRDIQSFYIKSVSMFFEACASLKEDDSYAYVKSMKKPQVWKTQGDEVLFWVEITDTRQVLLFVDQWTATIKGLRTVFCERKLDFKSTVWIAHFPWRNKMIFTSGTGTTDTNLDGLEDRNLELAQTYFHDIYAGKNRFKLVPDFVGPGVDIGFRLAAQASLRRMVLSTDVVYMIATAAQKMKRNMDDLPIHFEGMHLLKGVFSGLEYPLFWIDMIDESNIYFYGNDLGERRPCEPEMIRKFMQAFYHQRHNYLYEPFVVSETEQLLKKAPRWYVDAHKAMLAQERIDRRGRIRPKKKTPAPIDPAFSP
jgi:hypothetical protein